MKKYKFELTTEDDDVFINNTSMEVIHVPVIIGFLEMEKARLVIMAADYNAKVIKEMKKSKTKRNDK